MPTILTVEDSESMRQIVSYTLNRGGYEVVETRDGVEALERAKQQKFDMVLADVNMPNMDGLTLTRELRALPTYRYTPIIILTLQTGDIKERAKAAGATGWIVKPFSAEKLLQVVRQFLN